MQYCSSHNTPSVHLPSIHELSSGRFTLRNGVLSVARIDFAQMIDDAGAQSAADAICDYFEIDEATMSDIIVRAGASFFGAYRDWMGRPGGFDKLEKLIRSGGPQQFADRPELVQASISRQEGRIYLEYLFADDQVLRSVTQRIASRLHVERRKLDEMMPNIAALFVGVLCKSMA